jgi:lipid II:glycine glycyltransferase (peptidoglycan interpeptide bridge formation enzyme)
MGKAGGATVAAAALPLEAGAWDEGVTRAGGRLLQSWRWGAFKVRHGWGVERAKVERAGQAAYAQILFKHRGPLAYGYIPRGPVLSDDDPELLQALLVEIDRTCLHRRAISVVLEPERPLPLIPGRRPSLIPGPPSVQPVRTVRVPLVADEPLLMQMHQKTRYNIRLAKRRGVTVAIESSDAAFRDFFALMEETSRRNDYPIHAADYYRDALETFREDGTLMLARVEGGDPAAALIAVGFGDEAIYLYGASSTRYRSHGPGFGLQFEAMRWARERGYTRYDLWGIPATDPESTRAETGDRLASTRGDDWRGLYEFKVRFGGEIVSYPPPLERPYLPLLPALARRLYSSQA